MLVILRLLFFPPPLSSYPIQVKWFPVDILQTWNPVKVQGHEFSFSNLCKGKQNLNNQRTQLSQSVLKFHSIFDTHYIHPSIHPSTLQSSLTIQAGWWHGANPSSRESNLENSHQIDCTVSIHPPIRPWQQQQLNEPSLAYRQMCINLHVLYSDPFLDTGWLLIDCDECVRSVKAYYCHHPRRPAIVACFTVSSTRSRWFAFVEWTWKHR